MKNQKGLAATLRSYFQKAGSNPVSVNGTGLKFHPTFPGHQVVFLGEDENGQEVHFTPFPQDELQMPERKNPVADELLKFGITHVIGISDVSQLEEIYGERE